MINLVVRSKNSETGSVLSLTVRNLTGEKQSVYLIVNSIKVHYF